MSLSHITNQSISSKCSFKNKSNFLNSLSAYFSTRHTISTTLYYSLLLSTTLYHSLPLSTVFTILYSFSSNSNLFVQINFRNHIVTLGENSSSELSMLEDEKATFFLVLLLSRDSRYFFQICKKSTGGVDSETSTPKPVPFLSVFLT